MVYFELVSRFCGKKCSIIFPRQKPLFIDLAETINAIIFDLDVPFLCFPGFVPPFGICLPNAAVFVNMAAKILGFEIDQAFISHQDLGTQGRMKIAKRDDVYYSIVFAYRLLHHERVVSGKTSSYK